MSSVYSSSYSHRNSPIHSGPSGLLVQDEYGAERLVFSDQQLCDDLIATIPKLHNAVRRDMRGGDAWQSTQSQQGVEKYELVPLATGEDDPDLVHSIVAKTELRCHINEVLNVLVNQDSSSYDATMKALNGKKFTQGGVLFQQRCRLVPESGPANSNSRFSVSSRATALDDDETAQSGLVAVKLATIKPKFSLKLSRKYKRVQKLCFATFTHKYPSNDRAVHIIKTLPKSVHDQVVASENRSALRSDLDHLGVGFDIQFFPKPGGGSVDQTTRILAHGYASATPPDAFGSLQRGVRRDVAEIKRRREALMNPEARHVLDLLTDSLSQFERVIRRRRFGLQSFVYFPEQYEDSMLVKSCTICAKKFKFYRRDFFCQLCGQMSCGECSKLHEVEVRAGEIRLNRVCLKCIVRVDKCVFDDEDIVEALGPLIVSSDDREWYDDDRFHYTFMDDDGSDAHSDIGSVASSSDRSTMDQMTDQLYSDDPAQRSLALETLGQLVCPTAKHEYTYLDETLQAESTKAKKSKKKSKRKPKTLEQKVRKDVENHLSYSLRVNKDKYKPEELLAAGKVRDNVLEFDASKTMSPDQPLAPLPDASKEARRLSFIKEAKLLDPSRDNAALAMIAHMAAKRMNCSTGYISVLDDKMFYAVATYPETKIPPLPRNEVICSHTLYEEKPLIVNPSHDLRFRNMPLIKMSGTKFYAGFPIRAPDGSVVASLCTTDTVAHNHITTKEYATMESLAQLVSDIMAQNTGR
ncbi:hypothetical protein PybrP1_010544 [[Pythium] brassicae (nom. inval.)]|nr:hypothetical protein PybrP1_010544 [[Pythium] brassicae (nom. inval.)]